MSTTTHTPSESEGRPHPVTVAGTRPARLIRNESTTEIPVHLLFRDDPGDRDRPEGDEPARVTPKPAVVGRRQGTGELPRAARPAPARRRALPRIDPELAEREVRVLPGMAGVLAGACGVTGC
ncbi:SPFH domain-containing protein, partial [Streptomyces sp. SID69]|nr:SPFH domain-containing protein [Streptomyces sp. SID69]